MKKFSKILSVALLVALVLSLGITSAFAAKQVDVGTGTGSITLQNGTTGEKYQLYKVFDGTFSGTGDNQAVAYTFTKTNANVEFFTALNANTSPFTLTETATANVYTVVKKTTGVTDADLLEWVENNVKDKAYLKVGEEITLAEADNQAIEWTNLAYGYYMITSSLDGNKDGKSAVTIDSNMPNATVIDKNQTTSFDKNIIENGEKVKVNEADIIEDVNFDITVNSKNYEGTKKVFKYVIKDTMDPGWTIKADPIVKIAGVTKTAGTDYMLTYYKADKTTVTTTLAEAQYFEISIPWTSDGTKAGNHLYKANDAINVTYTAFLDSNKADQIHIGATPNLNEAEVDYFMDDDTPNNPSGHLPKVTTKTYETQLTIQKTDGSKALKGAEFQLTSENGSQVSIVTGQRYDPDNENGTYWKLKDGTYTTDDPTTQGMDQSKYEDINQKYALRNVADVINATAENVDLKAFVGEDGKLTFSGLTSGTYTLVETTVPAGFNKAADITFTISFNVDKTNPTNPVGKFTCGKDDPITLDATNNVFSTTVVNQSGSVLPSTGGIGTTIFYVVGGVLVLAAIILLVTKKRMSE